MDWFRFQPLISDPKIHGVAATLPPEVRASHATLTGSYVYFILSAFMSVPWTDENVYRAVKENRDIGQFGFFEIGERDDVANQTKMQRAYDLAEMLVNLQTVAGFCHSLH